MQEDGQQQTAEEERDVSEARVAEIDSVIGVHRRLMD
jgi:hypothetical protein